MTPQSLLARHSRLDLARSSENIARPRGAQLPYLRGSDLLARRGFAVSCMEQRRVHAPSTECAICDRLDWGVPSGGRIRRSGAGFRTKTILISVRMCYLNSLNPTTSSWPLNFRRVSRLRKKKCCTPSGMRETSASATSEFLPA